MFYLIVLLIVTVVLELYDLWKKGLKKTTYKLGIISLISAIINLSVLIPSITQEYSSTLYLLNVLKNHKFLSILWLLTIIIYLYFIFKTILRLTKKKKQNKKIAMLFYIISAFIIANIIFLTFHNLAPWLILISLLLIIFYTVKSFIQKRRPYNLIIILIISIMTFYSFFTYEGSVRLNICLMGYPIAAYKTGLEELTYTKNDKAKQYYPIKNIPVESGDMGIILVKKYFGLIKIAKYIGF